MRLLLLLGLLSVSVYAEPKEIASSLTLEQTVDAALRDNAQLRSMRAMWEAAKEKPIQERTLPNPMLAVKNQNGVDNFNFPSTQETRVEIEQSFPWPGQLGLTGKIAEKDAAAAECGAAANRQITESQFRRVVDDAFQNRDKQVAADDGVTGTRADDAQIFIDHQFTAG